MGKSEVWGPTLKLTNSTRRTPKFLACFIFEQVRLLFRAVKYEGFRIWRPKRLMVVAVPGFAVG